MDDSTIEPIERDSQDQPLLYSVLSGYFQLEELEPDDTERLDKFNGIIRDWFGAKLRWTGTSVFENVQAFDPSDFELISGHASDLDRWMDSEPADDSAEGLEFDYNMARAPVDEFEIALHSGSLPGEAAPYSCRFFSVIRPFKYRSGKRMRAVSMLRITVPDTCPLDEFIDRYRALAACLRLRWSNAGLGYSGWERLQYDATNRAVYAHARRHPGYDIGEYFRTIDDWHNAIRTVNWLTILGPELAKRAAQANPSLKSEPEVTIEPFDANLWIRAGEAPLPGDTNRRQKPRPYVRADQLVRSVRATQSRSFGDPWDDDTTGAWLRRFE